MRFRFGLMGATVLALLASMVAMTLPARADVSGLRVDGTRIVESNGSPFVIRGVSHPHAWYPSQTSAFAGIKSHGANAVRVVLSGGRWTRNDVDDVRNVVALCKVNRLICILENHDTTGYGEQEGAVTLDAAVDYWISVRSALVGEEDYVIVNIGNEPIGNNPVTPGWTEATSDAVRRMRAAGFDHLLMVDAPNWGQDWRFTMRDNAQTVFEADPDRNTVFSIHMYGVFDTAAEITSYLDAFRSAGLPLVIGEFGHNHSDGDPDEDTIMAQAQARGLGYIGWSWSGNSGGVEYLDMVDDFDPDSLTPWGERIFNGPDGIASTAREATIYGGGGEDDTTPPTAPGQPSVSDVTSSSARLTWSASTDSGGSGLAGYNVYREQGDNDTLLGQSTTASITLTGLSPDTEYEVYVRARDGAGNLSDPSPSVTFTTEEGPPAGEGGCSVTPTVQNEWNNGYVMQPVTVTNTGDAPITGWTVTFTLPSGHSIVGSWNAEVGNGQATNAAYNGSLAPGQSTTFGFQVSRPDGDTATAGDFTCTAN